MALVGQMLRRRWILSALVVLAALGGGGGALASSVRSGGASAGALHVSLSVSDPLPVPGETLSFRGRVNSPHPGQEVSLQELLAGGWRTVAKLRLGGRPTFSLSHALGPTGNYVFRAIVSGGTPERSLSSARMNLTASKIHKIKHVVIIMQENRSFDHYFGTFRGADGIPGLAGNPGQAPCMPDPINGGCDKPFHDRNDVNYGGPHGFLTSDGPFTTDLDCTDPSTHQGCAMDGFITSVKQYSYNGCGSPKPSCVPCKRSTTGQCLDVMGYHTGAEIPNYWRYAKDFVLDDHMFQSDASYSLPAHLYMVSEWSAICSDPHTASTCTSSENPTMVDGKVHYAWTDLTYLLHKHRVSWRYYIFKGIEPDCPGSTGPRNSV